MTNPRVSRGRKSQDFLAEYMRPLWKRAEGVAAALSGADVRFTDGVHFEVKATRGAPGTPALKQAETGAKDTGNVPIVVWRPPQHGEARIGEWMAYLRLSDLKTLLQMAGYGDN